MTSFSFLALALFAAASPALQGPATCPLAGGGVADGPPVTFERAADGASTIVEATVQSVTRDPQPTGPGSPIPREHAVLRATRVLKGPDSLGLFTASQIRATGLFAMQPGQQFILFLNAAGPGPVSPERPDLPGYTAAVGGTATLCIDAGKVWVNSAALRARFDGVDLEKAVADIQSYVKLRRVNGRVVAEDRPLPVAEFLINVPSTILELRSRPRIVLKPVDDRGGPRRQVIAVLTNVLSPGAPVGSLTPADATMILMDRTNF